VGNEFKFGTQKSIKTSPDKKLRKHNSSETNNKSSKEESHIEKGQKVVPNEAEGKASKANELSKSVNDGSLLKKKYDSHDPRKEGRKEGSPIPSRNVANPVSPEPTGKHNRTA